MTATATLHGKQGGGGANPRPAPLPPPWLRLPSRPGAAESRGPLVPSAGLGQGAAIAEEVDNDWESHRHPRQWKPGYLRSQVSTWEGECGARREPGDWDRVARPRREVGRRQRKDGKKLGLRKDGEGGSGEG